MIADRGKKSKRTEDEGSEHIDSDLFPFIEKLQEVQDQLDKVNEEAGDKVLEVEQKYNEVRRPVYVKRNEVIKSIPDFWLTAFLSHPALIDHISEEDTKILKYLDSIDVEDFKDLMSGYSITFNFKSNPYFEETKLTKSFTFSNEGTTEITGANIKWKEGMSVLANGVDQKKEGNKRPPTHQSFFSWFSESQQKDIVEGFHDEVAEIIKEDLWPNPLKYFNYEADEEDSDGDEEEEEEEEEEKGDEEEDEDKDGDEEDK